MLENQITLAIASLTANRGRCTVGDATPIAPVSVPQSKECVMARCVLATASLVLLSLAAQAGVVDLSKIDRTIAKEPKYETGAVKYCLLVFGPEAKTRVWLVQDGGTLYVDRNGNSDLTEPDEKVAATEDENTNAEQGLYYFQTGDIPDGALAHKNLKVLISKINRFAETDHQAKEHLARHPNARGYTVWVDVELPGFRGLGLGGRVEHLAGVRDVDGFLLFADRPQDAPVLHFGGPWQIAPSSRQRLVVGRETEFILSLGTKGIGAGSTVQVGYEGVVPENVCPTVEITFAPKAPGESPARELYELKHRC
jgi:hypothetical protein